MPSGLGYREGPPEDITNTPSGRSYPFRSGLQTLLSNWNSLTRVPDESITALLENAHRDLLAGRQTRARQFVQQALAEDRKAVLAHPLVYKMQLLSQVLSEPEAIEPRMPGIDPGVIRAYHEILESAPKRTCDEVRPAAEKKPAVLEIQEEACELEIVTDKPAGGPTLCIDRDGQRLRVQLQMCGWTFKLTDDAQGKPALSIGWTK